MNKKLLRLCCWALLLCQLLFVLPAAAENVEDVLVVGIQANRTTEIAPLNPQDRDMISLYGVVYESLVTIDDNGLPQPLLAESWAESGNGRNWTFTLRENVTFSDGTPLTAEDVVASCQYLLDMANNGSGSGRGFYQNIRYLVDSVRATDHRTVVVRGKRSYYGTLYSMTFPVIPASQVGMLNPVGTGPYLFSHFQAGTEMRLDVNPRWWQMEPQVKTIMVRCYLNNKTLINAYEFNEVDTIFTRSVAAAQYKSGISSLSVPFATRQLETLQINHRAFPLESLKVRQAIRYAINVPQISQNVFMGMTITAGTPIPSGNWLYFDQESTFTYNPQRAMELLAEEGWEDSNNDGVLDKAVGDGRKRLVLKFYVYEDPENDVRFETAKMIEDMLKAVKISAKPVSMKYEDMQRELDNGGFELALCAFQMDVVPDVGFFLHKNNQQNYGRYVSSDMSSLIDTLRSQYNRDEFAYTTRTIQQRFAADVPFVCLFYRAGAVLTRKMYTTARAIREFELLRGIESFGR